MTLLITVVAYLVAGWTLVYRDLMPRMHETAYRHFEEYEFLYETREARNGLIREYQTLGMALVPFLGLVFPLYFAWMLYQDRVRKNDVPPGR